jgi:hypothetical protein
MAEIIIFILQGRIPRLSEATQFVGTDSSCDLKLSVSDT